MYIIIMVAINFIEIKMINIYSNGNNDLYIYYIYRYGYAFII